MKNTYKYITFLVIYMVSITFGLKSDSLYV